MATISLCMIVKNEEKVLARCLESVCNIVDEIILVDTGSTDGTKEIALQYGAHIYDFTWVDDFSAARNQSFSLAQKDYIMWLDADDVLPEGDREKLLKLKKTLDSSVDSVTMKYNILFDKNGSATHSLRRNRLVRRSRNFKWKGAVHEYLEVYGEIINSDISIDHRKVSYDSGDRNLRIYQKMIQNESVFSPRDMFYYSNELYDHQMYGEAIENYKKFLNTKQGWAEDNITACSKLCDCYEHRGDSEGMLKYIFKSFEYDTPRAEFCCRLGYYFLSRDKIDNAIFWYKTAAGLSIPQNSLGMINYDCWTWLPHIQLCVCYDRLGDHKTAYYHNKIAESFSPNNPYVIQNNEYLGKIIDTSLV